MYEIIGVSPLRGAPQRKFSVEAIIMHFDAILSCESKLIIQALAVFKILKGQLL